ncbi:MAG: hypothetical protein DWC04_02640, partial [Candidatus Poseidoniales archaeon]
VHFGDEVESDDLPATPEPEAEEAEEAEETVEDAVDEAGDDDSEDTPKVTWREDVLLRVMEASGIDVAERDAFVEHAANFDLDENGYLKKAELEAAAAAWSTDSSEDEAEEAEDEAPAEEAPAEEAVVEEEATEEESIDDKMCPICMTMNAHDATECSSCKYDFTS